MPLGTVPAVASNFPRNDFVASTYSAIADLPHCKGKVNNQPVTIFTSGAKGVCND